MTKLRLTIDEIEQRAQTLDKAERAPVTQVMTAFVYPRVPHDITDWPDQLFDAVAETVERFERVTGYQYKITKTECDDVEPVCPSGVPPQEWLKRRYLCRIYLTRDDVFQAVQEGNDVAIDAETGALVDGAGKVYSRH